MVTSQQATSYRAVYLTVRLLNEWEPQPLLKDVSDMKLGSRFDVGIMLSNLSPVCAFSLVIKTSRSARHGHFRPSKIRSDSRLWPAVRWRVTTRSNLDRFGIMHHGQTGEFCLPLSAQSPVLAPYYAAWNQLTLRAMAEQADADKIPIGFSLT